MVFYKLTLRVNTNQHRNYETPKIINNIHQAIKSKELITCFKRLPKGLLHALALNPYQIVD